MDGGIINMNMFFRSKSVGTAAGKIKKMLGAAALAACCLMPMSLSVSAAESNEIKLEASGSEASLELYFPQAAAEDIASMQVSVSVRADSDSVDLEFIPDSGLSAKIVESRYQRETGRLNIYIAGTEPLFSASGFTKVGKVKVSTSGSNAASASVSVVEDSVKFVRSGELVSPDADYPASVTVTALGQSSPGTSNPAYPNYPTGNYFPNIPVLPAESIDETQKTVPEAEDDETLLDAGAGGAYDDSALEDRDTVGENMNPPDTSALLDALSRADDYRRTDYTENSYDDLKKAADRANEVVSDPYASQDEIDEALLDIENAIGMLRLRNDIPSGADGYGGNNSAGTDTDVNGVGNAGDSGYGQGEYPLYNGDNGSGDSGNDVRTDRDGNIVNASDDVRSVYADDPFSENENSGRSFPYWIIAVAVIAVAAAAAAVTVLTKANKKKGSDEKHFHE